MHTSSSLEFKGRAMPASNCLHETRKMRVAEEANNSWQCKDPAPANDIPLEDAA